MDAVNRVLTKTPSRYEIRTVKRAVRIQRRRTIRALKRCLNKIWLTTEIENATSVHERSLTNALDLLKDLYKENPEILKRYKTGY